VPGESQAKVPQGDASTHLPEEPGPLLEKPPVIPPPTLRLVVNILTAGDCSGRTFQHCLSLIQHLSCIPDAKDVIVNELQAKAHELGLRLYADLQDLIQGFSVVGDAGSSQLPDAFATKFSLPSADQAKFLRILKTIEYLFTTSQPVTAPSELVGEQENQAEDTVRLSNIYKAFQFSSVWQRLSDFLSLLHERTDIGDHATVLLPLIESLMVVCKHTESPSSETMIISSPNGKNDLFVTFTDAHRKVLNQMVRSNPSLMSGSFSLLIKNSRVLDFDNKRNYFTQQLRRRPHTREHHSTLQLNIRSARVFEDSYQYLQRKSGDQIKYGKLSIRFYGEEGVDAGGVTREWFTILARQMFNPDYALFQPCAADKLTYQPNRASSVNPEHLSFFKFVGRIIGKAIFDGRLLDAYFARSLFRQLLGKPVDYKDVEWVDPEYFKSLIWILENDPSPLDLTFIVEDSQVSVLSFQ
jgi:E3 ubiquitin-protein ligase HUWE1